MNMDEREFFLLGLGLLGLLASVAAVVIGIFGAIFISLSAFLVYQGSSYISRSPFRVSNFLKSYRPPRTVWCSKVEFGDIWIPPDVDDALERLYERIVTEFIVSWYKDISPDLEFIQQIRIIIRNITANIIFRLMRVDITELLMVDIVPIVAQHLDSVLWTRQHTQGEQGKKNFKSNYIALVGKDVHIALSSREAEVEYLEDLSARIIPLIYKEGVKSRLVSSFALSLVSRPILLNLLDSLCNPRNVNKLLCLWFHPDPGKEFLSSPAPPVKLLFRFVHSHHHSSPSSFHVDLSEILSNQELLCQFVHYLKGCGGVNLLNFCLAVEDFNKKIMNAGLTKTELVNLHAEAKVLFNTYMNVGSSQFISFTSEIVEDINNILLGEFKDVEKLRTTPPLFRAYEQAYNNLEDNFCPDFHLSSQYLNLNFGCRLAEVKPNSINKSSSQDRIPGGKLSRLKQGVLGNPVEGCPCPDRLTDSAFDLVSNMKNDSSNINQDLEIRDLSAWRVEIRNLETRSFGGKSCFVFILQVQRIDVASASDGQDLEWTVARQYHEFYTLQSALTQFHGVLDDIKLPARSKLFRGRGLDVLQSKIEPFQDYLVKLLQQPSLKKSDLLFTFLTSQEEFTEAASQLGLTRMIKNVPKKLTKEKGQSLHEFINSFINSTIPSKDSEFSLSVDDSISDNLDNKSIYADNFSEHFPFSGTTLGPSQTFKPDGLYEIILYLCFRVFKVGNTVIRLLYSVKWILETSVNHIVNYLLASKLNTLLIHSRVSYIIDVIQESIFCPEENIPDEEHNFIADKTLKYFRKYIPSILETISPAGFESGTKDLFQTFQDPWLNKQLIYTLLENILPKLFPELRN
ncbi:sorting nexin-14 isoform X3 [Eurytemora carolleeae]|uniref:sorting nexin-14 isoform X3 n=1 Tax=Eurytemora carolleeae TaxID=1294199 RepID=UPI000C76781D|nr:sorting nexin-14 isoform X3 [Eurytemora carolleeae]|eukprot:XP_023327510.1 sorting nexin-14-like isoform X3 [Eurytemora affinis]